MSCTLATALARVTDRSCGLVDLHLEFGDVGILCDVYPEHTIADACGPATPSVPSLRGCLHEVCTNVSVLTRPQSMLEVPDIMPESIARTVRAMGHMFRYVVIDAPRSSEKVAPEVFQGADHILIVMQMMVGHIYNGIRLLERFKSQGISEDRIEFVMNRQNANYQPFTTDEVESELPKRIYASIPNDFYYVSQANTLGSLCGDGMRSTISGRAIEDLARQIAIAGLAGTSPSGPEPSCIQKLTERRTRESQTSTARVRVNRAPVDSGQFAEQRTRSPASACLKP